MLTFSHMHRQSRATYATIPIQTYAYADGRTDFADEVVLSVYIKDEVEETTLPPISYILKFQSCRKGFSFNIARKVRIRAYVYLHMHYVYMTFQSCKKDCSFSITRKVRICAYKHAKIHTYILLHIIYIYIYIYILTHIHLHCIIYIYIYIYICIIQT